MVDGQDYFKITLEEDGVYKLSYQALNNAGVFSGGAIPTGEQLKMYYQGQEIPLYVTSSGTLGTSDYIEFFGRKNTGKMDIHLYEEPEFQLNPLYSLFTDVSSYFLTWSTEPSLRIINTPNDLVSPPSVEPYCMYEDTQVYTDILDKGKENGSAQWRCSYDIGEGFCKNTFSTLQNYTFDLEHLANNGNNANLSIRLFSKSGNHTLGVSLNGGSIYTENYASWAVKQINTSVSTSDFQSGNNTFNIEGTGSVDNDKFRLAYISLDYPRTLDFDNNSDFLFSIPGGTVSKYLEINDFDHGGEAPILYDISNNLRIVTQLDGNIVKVVLPAAVDTRTLFLSSTNNIDDPISIAEKQFANYDFANEDYDYIMVTHPTFFNDGTGTNYIQDYADYRSSFQGGEYNPLVVDVTDLYDQFGYGVDRNEMAIKNFMKLAENNWSPRLLYLIGKGVTYELMRKEPEQWLQYSFVPSFGYPSSDHLFVSPIGGSTLSMGVGRLAIKNINDLKIYFDKVIEYEAATTTLGQTLEEKEWMKKILHLGGGDDPIQDLIKGELNILKDTIESTTLGAEVTSFFKNCSDAVCPAADQVVPLINEGVAMMTFFGHSAPSTLDFDLGDPNEYDNKGKYPLFYAIGCNTNRIFETASTLSEDFVFIQDKGCIGFFGATWVTNLNNLSDYARYFYKNIGTNHYGLTLGETIKETVEDYSFSNSYSAELLRNGLVLHGDPAIRLYPFDAPDYLVKQDESSVNPGIVNAQDLTFDLNLTVSNIGRAVEDSINIHLEHELPNGETIDLGIRRVDAPSFNSTWIYELPLTDNQAIGLNYVNVTVDSDDEIEEAPGSAELNNLERIPFFIVANDIFPVYPYEFSITSDNTPKLRASTANAFSEELNYYFEIDTTELFNSPIKESLTQVSIGGVLDWEPNISMIDSTVYYWRVSIDSAEIDGGFNWRNTSFIYIPDSSPGWNQSHFWQYTKNEFDQVVQDSSSYDLSFTSRDFTFNHVNAAIGNIPYVDMYIFRESFRLSNYYPCSPSNDHRTVWILGFDPVTLDLGTTPSGSPSYNCFGGQGYGMIRKPNVASEREEMMDFIENVIPDNYYVVFFTTQKLNNNYHADEWAADSLLYGKNLFSVLEDQGAYNVRDIETNQTPYICVFKKNDPSFITKEFHADSVSQILDIEYILQGIERQSTITSTVIGPASKWETLLWDTEEYDPFIEDANIDIVGIDNNGVETLLVDSLVQYDYLLTNIAADQYPYIKLVYNALDSVDHTMPQLNYWRVLYDPIPEAALVPNKIFSFHNDTLQQGETLTMEIGIENIGEENMDSLLMHYTIINSDNSQVLITDKLEPLLVDGLIVGQLSVDTRDLIGNNRLIIEANPDEDQSEMFHYNNIGVKSFFVEGDERNPLLDVTFDGTHIMDGDLVSSEPEIVISLLDENPFLALTDTSLLRLFVTDPAGQIAEYNVDGDILTFYPATGDISDDNQARMEFRPELLIDGVYQLQVRGKDVTGNVSGDLEYRVNFEIINEETVSNVLNYPNPFSTSTQFVFTLTGNELPDVFRIQIMTVSGKIVKEISMADLGILRIGNNISDYRWDGTDDYGDKLANGVYLYRIMVKKNGEEYESYDNGTNQFFKKGFGKMVILR
ncbi:MAG: hypothetical protein ACI94Y_003240 [Maribacter sp.]